MYFTVAILLLCGTVISRAEVARSIVTVEVNNANADSLYVTLCFDSTVTGETAGNPNNYKIFDLAQPENFITPYFIDIDRENGTYVNLYCVFEAKRAYKVEISGDYRTLTYTDSVKDQETNKVANMSGIIMFENGTTGKPDYKIGLRPVNNLNNYCLDFNVKDTWFGILPYRFEGTLTTKPDSVQNYLKYSHSIGRFIDEAGNYELLGKVKIDANQKCENADITAGGGIAFFVPYSRDLPIIRVICNTKYMVRNARAYLGFDGGGAYKKGIKPNNVWRFNGEIAWRLPVLNTNSFISLQGKGWLLTNNASKLKEWEPKGHINLDIEYALSNMTGLTVSYENGSVPPDYIEKKSVSFGFKISPEFQTK